MEAIEPESPVKAVETLPPAPDGIDELAGKFSATQTDTKPLFQGGITAGLQHLKWYMDEQLPSNYKGGRNELDGWRNSSKLSAWLAQGCLTPADVVGALKEFEQRVGANESTC